MCVPLASGSNESIDVHLAGDSTARKESALGVGIPGNLNHTEIVLRRLSSEIVSGFGQPTVCTRRRATYVGYD